MNHNSNTMAVGSRPVGEFQGYVDGQPSITWFDRDAMPKVGAVIYAVPRSEKKATAFMPRYWSLLLTSENHGTVGPVGATFPHAGEKHERVVVVEVVEAGAPPAPGVDLAGLVQIEVGGPLGDAIRRDSEFARHITGHFEKRFAAGGGAPASIPAEQIEWSHTLQARLIEVAKDQDEDIQNVMGEAACLLAALTSRPGTPVAAQTGQVAVPSQSWEAIGPLPVDRDESGWWSHPAIPNFDEDFDSYLAWVKAVGLELKYKALESYPEHPLCDAWFEDGETNASSWEPEEPSGEGWFTFSIHDSEDGPIWAWARRIDRAAMQASTPGEHQEGGAA